MHTFYSYVGFEKWLCMFFLGPAEGVLGVGGWGVGLDEKLAAGQLP